jgi:putative SOS response-associated peptidase YedK
MDMAGCGNNLAVTGLEGIRSFTIITTRRNSLCAELHSRMPAVLKPEA